MIDPTGGPGQAGQSDSTLVYDGGAARAVVHQTNAVTLNAASSTLVAATASVRTKVLQFRVSCVTFTTAGQLYLLDGGAAGVAYMGQITAAGVILELSLAGLVVAQTPVNSTLLVNYSGNATLHYVLNYYQAP